ncbi:MAG: hypothetical protein IPM42_11880 [Saprospiraceae bacterium]|nr:hypothetical protein [Saprospiraceae bacterium]
MKKLILSVFILSLFLQSCKKSSDSSPEDISKQNELLSKVFDAATVGIISASDPLRYVLKEPLLSQPEESIIKQLIEISPTTEGTTTISNLSVITFVPKEPLMPDKVYSITINLQKLDSKKYPSPVQYEVRTFKQEMLVEREGFIIHENGSVSMLLNVQTADRVDPDRLIKCFSSDADQTDIIEVSDRKYQLDFLYNKGMKKSSFINYDGAAIHCETKGNIELFDLSSDQFGVVYTHHDQDNKEFDIYFSQPLNRQSDLTGLVRIMGNSANYTTKNNVLTIYLSDQRYNNKVGITLEKGIRSASGKELTTSYTFELDVMTDNPEVAFVSDGNYFPSEGQFKIPLKTRALESIRLHVIEIKQENVQHYLAWQSLSYSDFYNLRMYGKPVYDKEIVLRQGLKDNEGWTVYGIDLSEQLKKNPGSIYHISADFGPQNTTLSCKTELKKYSKESTIPTETFFSNKDYYYYNYSMYQHMNWEEVNDPCKISYYIDKQPVQKMFICSDYSIIAKKAGKDYHIALNKLLDLSPAADAEITLYDQQSEKMATAKTNSQGFAEFINVNYEAAVLKVSKSGQITYLPLDPAESNSLTEFDISGERSEEDSEFFVYTDRDIWRPGDSIYVDLMINKKYSTLPEGLPIVMSFYNTENLLVDEQIQPVSLKNKLIYSFTLSTNTGAKTGVYRCMFRAGPKTIRKNIRIETIKPNTTETIFTFNNFSENTVYSSTLSGNLKTQYLTGFEVKDAKIKTLARARKSGVPFAEFKDYQFDRYSKPNTFSFDLLEITTNNSGTAVFNNTENMKFLNSPVMLSLETETTLPGGGVNKEGRSIKISPFKSYIGAKRKLGTGWSGNHTFSENIELELISLNEKGKLSNQNNKIIYTLQKNVDYWWVDKYRLRSSGNFVQDQYWENIRTESKNVTGKDKITFAKGSLQKGAYRVLLTDDKSGHESEIYFSVYDGVESIPGTQPFIVEFETEKDEYKAGDDIKLKFPEIEGAKVLVSVERANKIISKQWYDIGKNKNVFNIKSNEDWAPNVYLHVTLIQPFQNVSNDLPLRMYGIRHLKMEGATTQLNPVHNLPEKMESNKLYTFTVSESEGRAMEYTISVVDEGLLSLTGFSTPDPHKHFNGKYPLLVKTWDIYKYLIQYFKGQFAGILSIGGDDAYNPDAIAEINRFKPVAIHLGPFKLAAGKKNAHTIDIPNYIGKIRVMIVAASENNFGKAEKFIPVKNPLMVQTQFPRSLNVSDKLSLPVTILKDDASINIATLTVTADNTLVKGFTPSKSISFAGKNQILQTYDIEVLNKTGKLDVNIKIDGGGKSMNEQTSILINYPNAYESEVTQYVLAPGEKIEVTANPKGFQDVFTSHLLISGLKVPNFTKYAQELISYPYGCLEQITSNGYGQLYLDKILVLDPVENRKRLENIQAVVHKLNSLQKSGGIFSYWENDYYHAWSDIYAGNFLVEMQNLNYMGGEGSILKAWLNVHSDKANKWSANELSNEYTTESEALVQAFRLYVLAKASKPAKSAMNRFVSNTKSTNPLTWWLLAGSFKVSGYESKAKEMIRKAESFQISASEKYHYNTFGEKGRDLAAVVEILSLFTDERAKLDQYYNQMVDVLNASSWVSTHTKGYAFMAAYKYFGNSAGLTENTNYNVDLVSGAKNFQHSAFEPKQIKLEKADWGKKIVIENKGKGKLFVQLSSRFIDSDLNKEASNSNLGLNVSYSNASNQKNPDSYKLGDDVFITATINNPSALDLENLALNLKMPAGWELINPRLYETEEKSGKTTYTYQDFRDDRVYTFFNLGAGKAVSYTFRAKSGFAGDFYLPAVRCEHMYKGNVYATTSTGRIKIIK